MGCPLGRRAGTDNMPRSFKRTLIDAVSAHFFSSCSTTRPQSFWYCLSCWSCWTSCSQRLDYQNQKQRIPILVARLSSEKREYHPPSQNYRVTSGQDCWSPSHRCHLSVSMSNPALESRGKGAVIMPYSCPAKKKLKTRIKGRLELELYSPKLTSNTSRSILKTILKQVWTYFTD